MASEAAICGKGKPIGLSRSSGLISSAPTARNLSFNARDPGAALHGDKSRAGWAQLLGGWG
jgi:hypothetical protein